MSDDENRKLILARRAHFVAAAVAGLVACEPGPDTRPMICLSQMAVPPPEDGAVGPTIIDAGASVEPDASATPPDASAPDTDVPPQPCLAPPMPCLSVLPPMPVDAGPAPQPCLSPARPPRPPPTSPTAKPPAPPTPRVCLSVPDPDG